jgi:hypothetical protein
MSKFCFRTTIGIGITALAVSATQVAQAGSGLTTQSYKVDDGCKIVTADKKQATLTDLKVGDKVNIRYRAQNGTLVADRIVVQQPRTTQQPKTPPPSGHPREKSQPTNGLLARGTIIDVDTQSNTVMIEEKPPRKN